MNNQLPHEATVPAFPPVALEATQPLQSQPLANQAPQPPLGLPKRIPGRPDMAFGVSSQDDASTERFVPIDRIPATSFMPEISPTAAPNSSRGRGASETASSPYAARLERHAAILARLATRDSQPDYHAQRETARRDIKQMDAARPTPIGAEPTANLNSIQRKNVKLQMMSANHAMGGRPVQHRPEVGYQEPKKFDWFNN